LRANWHPWPDSHRLGLRLPLKNVMAHTFACRLYQGL